MRIGNKKLFVVLMVGMVALLAASGYADDMTRSKSEANSMMHKCGRGIVNVLTGWMEVPKNIAVEWKKTEPFTGTIMGTIKGLGWGVGRTATGVYDIITFPLPIPEGYKPLMEPEFILPDLWGKDLPYFDEPIEKPMK
ncbi:MAG TPA: exosortase system-associated protein, TIGR04073 family [Candidatus Sumerlaeota bacterium]|nr:MAG: hypothetical protein BWY12_01452 [candidate division BRC1 bacterium ADurb.Bin183]HOE63912.1 exosortase system-associated protein, TIGR04073 family [Candidatus Sumerlaeota bacterium]HRR31640.1 exosortase system-associated protein, TIGR04073 family [Candidatus Sumerlaeia bacterium]HON51198.1 exosortase system-associated protein, TIGR04073 family [Candidatus Sumerlaeota bacterium]HOR64484.1 exosortase system-associated protein, TIGR04073 family [Candidatus Sumerlaeota bacterium]